MKIFSVLTLVLLALNLPLQAKVELPEQICSHMVIQQQTKAKLWGWARNGAKIDVTVSWNKENIQQKLIRQAVGRFLLTLQRLVSFLNN